MSKPYFCWWDSLICLDYRMFQLLNRDRDIGLGLLLFILITYLLASLLLLLCDWLEGRSRNRREWNV